MSTAGLSLRGIAREMGITAPAIYNYFPRLEDLITALIVDAFTALAEAMEAAEAAEESERPDDKIMALCLAYREWAMAGLFIPGARKSVEMMYKFEKPFVVDSSRFERAFGVKATPIGDAIKATVAWYRAHPQAKGQ